MTKKKKKVIIDVGDTVQTPKGCGVVMSIMKETMDTAKGLVTKDVYVVQFYGDGYFDWGYWEKEDINV